MRTTLDAPWRLGFAAGALVALVQALAWAWQLPHVWGLELPGVASGRTGPPSPLLPSLLLGHQLGLVLGAMPLFVAGFLFTAGPRWLQVPPWPVRELRLPLGLCTAPWCWWPWLDTAGWRTVALACCTAGWWLICEQLLRLRRHPDARRNSPHLDALMLCALLWGLCLTAITVLLAQGRNSSVAQLVHLALWGVLAPLFAVASHRLTPWLAESPLAPMPSRMVDAQGPGHGPVYWPLALLLLALGLLAWPGTRAAPSLGAATAVVAAAATALCTLWWWRWRGHTATRTPVPRQLLRALGWAAVALGLQALACWPTVDPALQQQLRSAATHALALGWMGLTLVTMVSRICATQTGQTRALDGTTGRVLALVHAACACRVLGQLLPLVPGATPSSLPASGPPLVYTLSLWLTAAAAFSWAAASLAWAGVLYLHFTRLPANRTRRPP